MKASAVEAFIVLSLLVVIYFSMLVLFLFVPHLTSTEFCTSQYNTPKLAEKHE
jgi:hypothetical protein